MDYAFIPDLARRAAELAQTGLPTEHVAGRALFTDDHVKVLAFPFEAGQSLAEHTSPHPAIIHVLEGEATITLGDDTVQAQPGAWIHMDARLPHSIHAQTQFLMLLLVFRTVR